MSLKYDGSDFVIGRIQFVFSDAIYAGYNWSDPHRVFINKYSWVILCSLGGLQKSIMSALFPLF